MKDKITKVILFIVRIGINFIFAILAFLLFCCFPYDEWGQKNYDALVMVYPLGLCSFCLSIGVGAFYIYNWRKKWYVSNVIYILFVIYSMYKVISSILIDFGLC